MSLQQVTACETLTEIASALQFRQLYIVWMRLQGYSSREIARGLGVSHQTVTNWLHAAQQAIVEAFPELEAEAKARRIPTRTKWQGEPDDWEWLGMPSSYHQPAARDD